MKNEQAKSKPVAEVRLGNIRAAIWRNESENGPWFNATFERSYREGNDFRSSFSFGRDDLLVLSKAADLAHTRIFELQQESREVSE